jgi:hypothetical protein
MGRNFLGTKFNLKVNNKRMPFFSFLFGFWTYVEKEKMP